MSDTERFTRFTDEELAALSQGMRDLASAPGHLAVPADKLHDEVQTLIEAREQFCRCTSPETAPDAPSHICALCGLKRGDIREQHRFLIVTEVIEPGDWQTGHANALALGQRIFDEVVEEAEIVVKDGDDTRYHGIPNGVYCEGCVGHIVPGVRWPTASNDDNTHSWVERCDTCNRCESDDDALSRVLEFYDGGQAEMTYGHAFPAGSSSEQPFLDIA